MLNLCACSVRNQLLDEACKRRHGAPVRISVDGRWSSRRQAMEGTVTCFDADTKEIIDTQHIGERLLFPLPLQFMRALCLLISSHHKFSAESWESHSDWSKSRRFADNQVHWICDILRVLRSRMHLQATEGCGYQCYHSHQGRGQQCSFSSPARLSWYQKHPGQESLHEEHSCAYQLCGPIEGSRTQRSSTANSAADRSHSPHCPQARGSRFDLAEEAVCASRETDG